MNDFEEGLIEEVLQLADASLSSQATAQEIDRLEQLVLNDDHACRLYVDMMFDAQQLRHWSADLAFAPLSDTDSFGWVRDSNPADRVLPLGPAQDERQEISSPFPLLSTTLPGTVGFFSSGWPVAYLVATVVMGIAILVGSLIHVSQPGEGTHGGFASDRLAPALVPGGSAASAIVARITGMVDCQWEGSGFRVQSSGLPSPAGRGAGSEGGSDGLHPSSLIPHPSSPVSLGDRFALASGLMEITYDTGAKVILQGPVTYEVESKDGGYLSLGKLTAKVQKPEIRNPKSETSSKSPNLQISKSDIPHPSSLIPHPSSHPSSLIPHPLFAVRTPTATVTDLGTEFGVQVNGNGATTSHVFRGVVELQVISIDGKLPVITRILHENESARVENRGGRGSDNRVIVLGPSAKPADFVREIPKQTVKTFDLVDVVAGGNGFSGRRNRGINPNSGRVVESLPEKDEDYYLHGDGHYHRVEGLPFIDGVCVLIGGARPVQIDSAGHAFAESAEFTVNENRTVGPVWAGGAGVPSQCAVTLGGVDYASPDHGVLIMRTNKAVTFDLKAIRRANQGCKLVQFRAVTGNPEPASARGRPVYADVWVLVDGQSRFRRREINGLSGYFNVAVPLAENDRFLTLAATDGGNGIESDSIIFGDPRLELVSAPTAVTSISREATAR